MADYSDFPPAYWAAFGAQMGLMLRAHEVTRTGLRDALRLMRQYRDS